MQDQRKTKSQLIEELAAQRQESEALRSELAALRRQTCESLIESDDHADGRASAQRYRSVVDNIVDGIITIDSHGCIESMNPAAEAMFGYSLAECVGQNVSMLMMEPIRSQHDGFIQRYLDTGEKQVIGIGREVEGRRCDGTAFPMELAVGEFWLGSRRMFTGILRDSTERKQLETQLVQAQKMESIGQLAGGIAHDFNNQLGIILFDVDLLLAGSEQHLDLRDDLLKIRKVVLRGANLARQLLLFSRRKQIEPRPTDLNHHVQELRKMLGRLLGETVIIQPNLAADLWRVSADPGTMEQVILNLAINGRDAMPEGGTLRFETRNIGLDERYCRHHSQARCGQFVCLEVQDTGVGMTEDVRLRVFEPFFTTKEEGKGTGLGLSVVYGIVQAHLGWIDVDSSPGVGSSFTVYLPALEQDGAVPGPTTGIQPARHRGHGERILLLEDERELRDRAAKALRDHGYSVAACGSLVEARAAFQDADGAFDMVVSDVVLPDGRGTDLVFQLRDAHPGLAALLTTGYVDDHPDWERASRARLRVLEKPFTGDQLIDQVQAALG
jgi:PAS domain S-box-containing protein